MNPKHLLLLTGLFLIAGSHSVGQIINGAPPFSAIYAFGDCLTDTHNYPPPFPNWHGRYSNGPMWIELISTNLGLTYDAADNLACSGANTSGDHSFDLLSQIGRFAVPSNASNSLFVVWAGPVDFYYHLGEDYFFGPFVSPTNDAVWSAAVLQGVSNLSNAVVRLYAKGARAFLVPNVDDVSRQPVVIRTQTPATRSALRNRVVEFNNRLAWALLTLDRSLPDLRIVSPDAFGLISGFIDHPTDYGMTKTYPAAMQDPDLTDRSFSGPGADYVFWDEYGHPTAKAHAFIAQGFLASLVQARPETLRLSRAGENMSVEMDKLLIGRAYSLQVSTNLVDWQEVFVFTAQNGTNSFPAPEPAASAVYFRLAWWQ